MGATASQITSLTIVYSIVYSDADQRRHQSSASLAFVWGIHRGPVNSSHKGPVTRNMFPFDDVIVGFTEYIWNSKGKILVVTHTWFPYYFYSEIFQYRRPGVGLLNPFPIFSYFIVFRITIFRFSVIHQFYISEGIAATLQRGHIGTWFNGFNKWFH